MPSPLARYSAAADAIPASLDEARDALRAGVARLTTTTAVLAAAIVLALALATAALIRTL